MTNPTFNVHPATADEAANIAALVNAAYSKWIDVIGGKPMPMTVDYAALIAKNCVYSVREEADLVAVLVIWPLDDALYIDNIAVAPTHQGRGIGDRLLAFAEQKARELKLDRLTLLTNEKMVSNQIYYRKHGYAELRREIMPNGRRAVWMQKDLRDLPDQR